MSEIEILEDETLDDLGRGSLFVLQKRESFRFGMDSVLLAWFAASRRAARRVADLGTGCGVLPLLLSARLPEAVFDAIEIQPALADMASRSVLYNALESRIRVHRADLRDAPSLLGHGAVDLVVSNPPYGKPGGSVLNPDPSRRLARHEIDCTIVDICKSASALLMNGRGFATIFPAPRLPELFDAMKGAAIEPKRIRLVSPREGEAPNLALVEGVKLARPSLHFLPTLTVRGMDGMETEALKAIYAE